MSTYVSLNSGWQFGVLGFESLRSLHFLNEWFPTVSSFRPDHRFSVSPGAEERGGFRQFFLQCLRSNEVLGGGLFRFSELLFRARQLRLYGFDDEPCFGQEFSFPLGLRGFVAGLRLCGQLGDELLLT